MVLNPFFCGSIPHMRLVDKERITGRDCSAVALVAQWIEHQTSNLGVAGSSPAKGITFIFSL